MRISKACYPVTFSLPNFISRCYRPQTWQFYLFFLLFSFLVFTKCQVLSLRVGRSRDQVLQRTYSASVWPLQQRTTYLFWLAGNFSNPNFSMTQPGAKIAADNFSSRINFMAWKIERWNKAASFDRIFRFLKVV